MKTAIIGAGIAGLAAAVRLQCAGHSVHVFEANPYPGGKLSSFSQDGYTFDAGPSLFTMPHYVDELFILAGENPEAHFKYKNLETACRYFWDDGTTLNAWADIPKLAREVEEKLDVPAKQVEDFFKRSKKKYDGAGRIFLEKSLHKAGTWLSSKVLRALFRMPFYDLFSSMHHVHASWFQNPKMVQFFDRYATYNGSDPYEAPGMLTIIPHFEHGIGTFYPEGGMHSITQSVYELALRKGVQFHFNHPVERILVDKGKATGICANGKDLHFDRVVSNMDVFYTYKKLMPEQDQPERILSQPKSSSALIFYWGVQKQFQELGLHNIFFSNDYQKEFEAIGNGTVGPDPTVYINITSKHSPEHAPTGGENWFVMVNTPCNQGQDWDALIPEIKKHVLDKLSDRLGTDISQFIETESILDPRLIDGKTGSHLGALYGYSSNNKMAAFLRHPNFSRKIGNLYFVGGSVHPGGGIPLCLLSAKITSELVQ
jgi:phytoene desaturase